MPAFLHDEMTDFIEMRDEVAPDERLPPPRSRTRWPPRSTERGEGKKDAV